MRHIYSPLLLAVAVGLTFTSPAPGYYPLPPEETGDIYVSSYYNDRICVYTPDGTFLRDFTGGGLQRPRGLVISSVGEIYVASQDTDEILVFGPDEVYRRSFTGYDLDGPAGMASGLNDILYVCGANSNRLYVFNADDELIGFVEGGGLSWPNGVAIDLDGNLYVTSVNTADVRKYDPSGEFQYAIGGGGLIHPTGLALAPSGVLYVAGSGSNNVVKYDTEGDTLGVIEHPDFASSQSIAIDDEGWIFVTQFSSDACVVFNANEEYELTITGGTIDAPRALAFMPLDAAEIPGSDPTSSMGPSHLRMTSHAPEPFNETTQIRFELTATSRVSLGIYDPSGRLVRHLQAQALQPGYHIVAWDGRDGRGRHMASGTYLYDLRAGQARSTGTFTLLR